MKRNFRNLKYYIKSLKFNSLFIKLLAVFCIIVILPLLLFGIFSYKKSYDFFQETTVQGHKNALEETKTLMDMIMSQVDRLTYQIGFDENLKELLYKPFSADRFYILSLRKKLAQQLTMSVGNMDVIDHIGVYIEEDDTFISSDNGTEKLGQVQDKLWSENYESLKIKQKDSNLIILVRDKQNGSNSIKVLTVIRKLPLVTSDKLGFISIDIDISKMLRYMNDSNKVDRIEYTIIDKQGRVIMSNNEEIESQSMFKISNLFSILEESEGNYNGEVYGRKAFVCFTSSSYNDWKYIAVIPASIMDSYIVSLRRFVSLMAVILMLVSLMIAFYIAVRIYTPIGKLLSLVADDTKEENDNFSLRKDEIGLIARKIEDSRRDLREKAKNHLNFLKERFFIGLLNEQIDEEKLKEYIEEFEIKFKHKRFSVVVISVDGYKHFRKEYTLKERGIIKAYIINICSKLFKECFDSVCIDYSDRQVVVIANYSDVSLFKKEVETLVKRVQEEVEEYFQLSISGGISMSFLELSGVAKAYHEALQAVHFSIFNEKSCFVKYEQISELERVKTNTYPIDMEKEIIRSIKAGDYEGARLYIDKIKSICIESRDIAYIQVILAQITYSLYLAMHELDISDKSTLSDNFDLYDMLEDLSSIHDVFCAIDKTTFKIVEHINKRKKEKNSEIISKVVRYIEDSYSDYELGVGKIAQEMGLSSSYLSRMFSEEMNETLSNHIIKLRMDKAKELLLSTCFTINDISQKVGYINTQSFIRTFKNFENTSPNRFREGNTG